MSAGNTSNELSPAQEEEELPEDQYQECPLFCVDEEDKVLGDEESEKKEHCSIKTILKRHAPEIFSYEACKTEEQEYQVGRIAQLPPMLTMV